MIGLSLPGSNTTVSSRGAASFVPRKLSTAVAIESNNYDDNDLPLYSSGFDHSRTQLNPRFGREAVATSSRSSRSGSCKAGEGGVISHSATRSVAASPIYLNDDKSKAPTTTPSTGPSPTPHHTNPSSSSWRFPAKKGSPSYFSDDSDSKPLEPVQSWPSTANALSELYKSLRQINSTSTKSTAGPSSPSALRSALLHYNYLSRLQSMYDTILIPRRHTRTLFLLQGRETKTRGNLEQLLRMTTDLIWLNEKERQRKRRSSSTPSKLALDASTSATSAPARQESPTSNHDAYPHVYNPADDYHGLRVSEYTVLMNWIGSVTSTIATHSSTNVSVPTNSSSPSSHTVLPTSRGGATQHYQHPIAQSGPVDQAWAIWQDFLLTGMKPDIVLYTMLIDTLLKAKDFDRADQIWNHMQCLDSSSGGGKGAGLGTMGLSVPRSFNLSSTNTNSATATGLSNTSSSSSPSSPRSKKHTDTLLSPNSSVIAPNLQTLSVLMQSHIQQQDIDGVARTYKQLHQTTLLSRDQQQQRPRPINIVLVNQILKVLVDLGETHAAREIFAEMRVDGGDLLGAFAIGEDEKYTNSDNTAASAAPSTTSGASLLSTPPIHHQTSHRRASWKREIRKKQRPSSSFSTPDSKVVTSSTTGSETGTEMGAIRPNDTTYRLMLQVARSEMDSEFEEHILRKLQK
ncbi:hypothetical protein BGX24_008078 [Mortierella sp. AD032]|nr:hypothetical protein BGX24_008078 [Mortierella sp. AD032]